MMSYGLTATTLLSAAGLRVTSGCWCQITQTPAAISYTGILRDIPSTTSVDSIVLLNLRWTTYTVTISGITTKRRMVLLSTILLHRDYYTHLASNAFMIDRILKDPAVSAKPCLVSSKFYRERIMLYKLFNSSTEIQRPLLHFS